LRRGVLCLAVAQGVPDEVGREVRELLELLGRVVELDDALFDAATAVMGCSPAYLALAMEEIADAGSDEGLEPQLARSFVVDAAIGTAGLRRRPAPGERARVGAGTA